MVSERSLARNLGGASVMPERLSRDRARHSGSAWCAPRPPGGATAPPRTGRARARNGIGIGREGIGLSRGRVRLGLALLAVLGAAVPHSRSLLS